MLRKTLSLVLFLALPAACAEGAQLEEPAPDPPLQAIAPTEPPLGASSVCGKLEPTVRRCGGKLTHADCVDTLGRFRDEVLSEARACADKSCSALKRCLDDAIGESFGVTSAGSPSSDGGTTTRPDGSTSMPACRPVLTSFTPSPYKPPRRQVGACTSALASDLEDCLVNGNQTKCQLFQTDPQYQACATCAITQDTDPQWGPVVVTSTAMFPNDPGCYGLSLGEGTSTTGCGASMRAFEECTDVACRSCPLSLPQPTPSEMTDYDDCRNDAASTVCAAHATNATRLCAFDGGGPPAACQSSFAALVGVFCGP
jgi:hypothetical protein